MTWKVLLARGDVDLTTISGIDLVFFDHVWKFAKTRDELFFTCFKGKQMCHYIAIDSQALGRSIYKEYFDTHQQVENHYKEGLALIKEVEKTCAEWKKEIKTKSTPPIMSMAFDDFQKQFMKVNYIYSITSWLAIEAWQNDCEKAITALIKKTNLKNPDQIISSIYEPWKKTAILEIQDKIAKGKTPAELTKEYQFLRSWVAVWYRPIDEMWIVNLKPLKPMPKPLSRGEIEKILQPNSEEKHFIEMAPYIIFFKDWRDDVRRRVAYAWSFLFEAIARHFNVAHSDLGYLTLEEITNALQNDKLEIYKINQRKTQPCIVTSNNGELKISVIDGELPAEYKKVIEFLEHKNVVTEIKGLIAQSGRVTGHVRLIKSFHDVKKVEEGDVLVANTTHPNYLPAMQKACAFVTNEGGVVSHAAIVAREMKKPCIVGTKVATKMLKDGDLVTVDANNGIVTKS